MCIYLVYHHKCACVRRMFGSKKFMLTGVAWINNSENVEIVKSYSCATSMKIRWVRLE